MKNNNNKFNLSIISKACIVALGLTSITSLAEDLETQVQNKSVEKSKESLAPDETEVIEVLGVKGSIRESINHKRFADEIMDTISAEDIGQLPDQNIAESLSRITGVTITRNDEGEGTGIDIRGSFDNNIEINGNTLAGSAEMSGSQNGSEGLASGRGVNLQDIPSELFAGIDVYKTAQADNIEGSLGGTVNLRTKKPLNVQKDGFVTLNVKARYSELSEETDPEYNLFLGKKLEGTKYGDFGALITLTQKEVTSVSESYGSGLGSDAGTRWVRQTGFNGAASGPNGNDLDDNYIKVDVNGDGVSDVNDVYYVPNDWTLWSNERASDRSSVNATFQWQPNDKLSIVFDGTYAKYDDIYQGSKFGISGFKHRAFALESDNFELVQLGNVPGGEEYWKADNAKNTSTVPAGPVAYVKSGLLGGGFMKMGCAPCQGVSDRTTSQYNLAVDYQIQDNLLMEFNYSTSSAESERFHGQMQISQELGGDWKFHNNHDTGNVISFNEGTGPLADIAIYNSVDDMSEPLGITPGNLNDNWRLHQHQRQAKWTQQDADAVQLDFTYDLEGDFLTEFKFGGRWAKRSYGQQAYYNQNQKDNGVNWAGLPQKAIQGVFLNSAMNSNPDNNELSNYMQSCLTTAESKISEQLGGSMPTSYATFDCDMNDMGLKMGLQDIYAIHDNGDPVFDMPYENTVVDEETSAAYLKLSFSTTNLNGLKGKRFWGNIGTRYVRTDVTGMGIYFKTLEDNSTPLPEGELPYGYKERKADYYDYLPSLNVNFAPTQDSIIRLGWGETLGRRGLLELAPRMELFYPSWTPEEYSGAGTSGNVKLPPRRAENIDLSYEYYFADAGMISIAGYYREIDDVGLELDEEGAFDLNLGSETYYVRQRKSIGHARRKGFEFSYQQSLEMFSSIFKHMGYGINYTHPLDSTSFTDQEGTVHEQVGQAKHSGNAVVYYDDNKFSIRAAYNYRSAHVIQRNKALSYGQNHELLPIYKDDFGQLDINASYTFSKHLKVNLAIVNATDEYIKTYAKYEEMVDRISYLGRRWTLGVTYKF